MMRSVIGLEIHAQLSTKTKAFCSCKNEVDADPNTNICPICTGQPGALPVLNDQVVEYAIRGALALNCEVHKVSSFDRKNYFYPDLPKGYQITQYFHPIATKGYVELNSGKRVRIRRIHIEEDAGKMFHSSENITESESSLVDLNRCGVPLIEIVSEPDMEKPQEAREFMEKLRDVLRAVEISTGNMEEGALRCDANVSVVDDNGRSSSRVEVKNINSFRFVQRALEYEIDRISKAMKSGKNVPMETRGWDSASKSTVSMRSKEAENDYRYFPEPDLPILVIAEERIERIKNSLPELPDEKAKRYEEKMGIQKENAKILSKDKGLSKYFEDATEIGISPKDASNWIVNEVMSLFNANSAEFDPEKVPLTYLKKIIDYTNSTKISRLAAKEVIDEVYKTGEDPDTIVKKRNLLQMSDEDSLVPLVREAIAENPKVVEQYRKGKGSVVGFFVGAVMKKTNGKADPKLAGKLAKKLLDGEIE